MQVILYRVVLLVVVLQLYLVVVGMHEHTGSILVLMIAILQMVVLLVVVPYMVEVFYLMVELVVVPIREVVM